MKKLFIFWIFSFLINLASAIPTIYALHINGINTTKPEAYQNLDKLREAANIDASTSLLKWDVIYNPTDTINDNSKYLTNLEDVMLQKYGEALQMGMNDAIQLYMFATGLDYPVGSAEFNNLTTQISNDIKEHFLGKNFDTIVNEFHNQVPPELAPALKALAGHETKDYGKFNNYVLLIPHSQGNLYANELYDYLTTEEHYNIAQIQIFGIATPASQLKGAELLNYYITLEEENPNITKIFEYPIHPYVTSKLDWVINLLSVMPNIPKPLPANMTIPWGHDLVSTYLADEKSRHEIAKSINYIIASFVNILIPSPNNSLPTANMSIQIIKNRGRDSIVDSNNQYVCSGTDCPKNNGYYKNNIFTQNSMYLGYYFFDDYTGYKILLSDSQQNRGMFINFLPHDVLRYINGEHAGICKSNIHDINPKPFLCAIKDHVDSIADNGVEEEIEICNIIKFQNLTDYLVGDKCVVGSF